MTRCKTIFVTGAARGLGASIVARNLELGNNVFATARNLPDQTVCGGGKITWQRLDVADYEQCQKAIDTAVDTYGEVDILINNASGFSKGHVEALTEKQISDEIDITFRGAVFLSSLYVKAQKRHASGKVIFVSSTAGLSRESGCDEYSVYAATKAALIRFAECLNEDIRRHGMSASVIVPCNMREDDPISQAAVTYKGVVDLIELLAEAEGNLSVLQSILSPALIQLP